MKMLTINRFESLDYACTEALNTLCTNLSFSGSSIRKVVLTSCQGKEGKSFLAMNLMRSLSSIGRRVVLVDADLRKSVLMGRYSIQTEDDEILGLTHYLAGMCSIEDIVYQTNILDAYMVLSGRDVANSLSLLSTPRLPRLLDALKKTFDIVLIDAPPVGVIIDAAEIAKSCDGVLFVVSNNVIGRKEFSEATRQLKKTGCPILGAVLNKVTFDTHSSKRYYYRTYYSNYNRENTRPHPQRHRADLDDEPYPAPGAKGASGAVGSRE